MDGVRLTTPTILQNVQNYSWGFGGSQSPTLPAEAAPSSVLLVVAQGGHRIAYHHPNTGEALPAPLARVPGFDPIVLADLLMTKAGRYEQLLDLTVGDCRLIGWPVALTLEPFMRASAPASGKGAPLSALNVVFTLAAAAAPSDEARYERVVAACKSATEQLALALQREEACGGFVSRHVFGVEEAAHAGVGAVAGAETSTRSAIDGQRLVRECEREPHRFGRGQCHERGRERGAWARASRARPAAIWLYPSPIRRAAIWLYPRRARGSLLCTSRGTTRHVTCRHARRGRRVHAAAADAAAAPRRGPGRHAAAASAPSVSDSPPSRRCDLP